MWLQRGYLRGLFLVGMVASLGFTIFIFHTFISNECASGQWRLCLVGWTGGVFSTCLASLCGLLALTRHPPQVMFSYLVKPFVTGKWGTAIISVGFGELSWYLWDKLIDIFPTDTSVLIKIVWGYFFVVSLIGFLIAALRFFFLSLTEKQSRGGK